MFKVSNEDTGTMSLTSFWSLLLTLIYYLYLTSFSTASIIDFEQVNIVCWVGIRKM